MTISENYRASKNFIEILGVKKSLASFFIPATGLLVGQYDPLKTSVIDYVPVKVTSSDDVGNKAGFGSHAHRQALRLPPSVFNQGGGIWWAPVPEEGAAAAATESVTFVGTATSSGTIYFLIGGDLVQVPVLKDDTEAGVATALVTAITADQDLPVTASAALGVVTVTAKFKGLSGNQILIKLNPAGDTQENQNPSGIATTLSEADGYLASGATDPSVEDVFFDGSGNDILGDRWYTDCTAPYTDQANLNFHKSSGDARANPEVNRLFNHVAGFVKETYSAASALPANTNSEYVTEIWEGSTNSEYVTEIWEGRAWAPAFELGAALFGLILDSKNTAPNQPYKTLDTGIPADATEVNQRYGQNDVLFKAGMSYCVIDGAGVLRLGDIALTHRTNASGGATEEWFDTVTLANRQTKAYSLEQLFLGLKYQRAVVVADEDVTAVSFAVPPKQVIADVSQLVRKLWGKFAWTKNVEEVIKTITGLINAGNGSRIDGGVVDDEAKALRIIAFTFSHLF
jgi:phage tail sheath gpL-like